MEECPEHELDLFEVAAGFAAELGTGTAQVVGAEAFDPDLPCGFRHDGPDGPVAETCADLAALPDGSQQKTVFDAGRTLPGVDPVLDPHGNGDGADASALAAEIADHPAILRI